MANFLNVDFHIKKLPYYKKEAKNLIIIDGNICNDMTRMIDTMLACGESPFVIRQNFWVDLERIKIDITSNQIQPPTGYNFQTSNVLEDRQEGLDEAIASGKNALMIRSFDSIMCFAKSQELSEEEMNKLKMQVEEQNEKMAAHFNVIRIFNRCKAEVCYQRYIKRYNRNPLKLSNLEDYERDMQILEDNADIVVNNNEQESENPGKLKERNKLLLHILDFHMKHDSD